MSKTITLTAAQAMDLALREELARDAAVLLMGEGSATKHHDLVEAFGPERVRNTPLAEAIIAGTAVGAAASGLRPVIDLLFAPFMTYAMDALVNSAGKLRYLSGGQFSFPLVALGMTGSGWCVGGQHNHNLEALFVHAPGLKVVMPSTPADFKGLLKAAIRDNDPVLFIEHALIYATKGEVPEEDYVLPIGKSVVRRPGKDVTIVSYSRMALESVAAAEELAKEGIDCEIIDLRSLRPLDMGPVLESLKKTNRVVIAEEGWKSHGIGAEVSARIMEEGFDDLDAPVKRVAGIEIPDPYNKHLEYQAFPHKADVIKAVREVLK